MADTLRSVDRPWVILQQIKAGSQFTGVMPKDGATFLTPTVADWTFAYDPGTVGGLFDPTSSHYTFEPSEPVALVGLSILFGGQSSWTLSIANAYDDVSILLSGTTTTELVRGASDHVVLTWGQKLALVTVGASAAMTAALTFAPISFFNGR